MFFKLNSIAFTALFFVFFWTGYGRTAQVMINALDLNPGGKDSGKEWVELYNVAEIDVDLSGWTLETTHGYKVIYKIPEGVIICAGECWIYTHDRQWLDNIDEMVILRDAQGKEVDRTPLLSDERNDDGYWRRKIRGMDTNSESDWEFKIPEKIFEGGEG